VAGWLGLIEIRIGLQTVVDESGAVLQAIVPLAASTEERQEVVLETASLGTSRAFHADGSQGRAQSTYWECLQPSAAAS
jgi:hypothetical protein